MFGSRPPLRPFFLNQNLNLLVSKKSEKNVQVNNDVKCICVEVKDEIS